MIAVYQNNEDKQFYLILNSENSTIQKVYISDKEIIIKPHTKSNLLIIKTLDEDYTRLNYIEILDLFLKPEIMSDINKIRTIYLEKKSYE